MSNIFLNKILWKLNLIKDLEFKTEINEQLNVLKDDSNKIQNNLQENRNKWLKEIAKSMQIWELIKCWHRNIQENSSWTKDGIENHKKSNYDTQEECLINRIVQAEEITSGLENRRVGSHKQNITNYKNIEV